MPYAVRPDVSGVSPVATHHVANPRDTIDRPIPVFGLAVHCTGSGIVTKALKNRRDPFAYALEYYGSAKYAPYFAHYVVGFGGEVGQVADEHEDASHVGFPPDDRRAFLAGTWPTLIPGGYGDAVAARWRARWPGVGGPAHLFPGASPNAAYCGAELLVWQEGCPGAPRAPGEKYTAAQYDALARLARDVARRWGWPAAWWQTGRLAAHEDLNPLSRTSLGQGWDPGVMRDDPWFAWGHLLDLVRSAEEAVA